MTGYLYRGQPGLATLNDDIMRKRPSARGPVIAGELPGHGTAAGYRAHLRRHQVPCDPCRSAAAAARAISRHD